MLWRVGLQNRSIKEPLSSHRVGRKDNVCTIPIATSADVWRPEASSWTLQIFILELWRNPTLLLFRPLCHKEGSFGKHDAEAGSLTLHL